VTQLPLVKEGACVFGEYEQPGRAKVWDERLEAEEQNNYIVFYLIELNILIKTL
jgi:hypothetical protein